MFYQFIQNLLFNFFATDLVNTKTTLSLSGWSNLSRTDTEGTEKSVHINEMTVF